jgi:mannose-1-phosphate guanylyltransferase/mannose-6-phosphate isomerase
MHKKIALILAGGKGTRLWPLSRENYPKQFVEFKDGQSLFQLTLRRSLALFPAGQIFIISQESYRFTIYNQIELSHGINLQQKGILKDNIILEPVSKNTLPAILFALRQMEEKIGLSGPDLVYVFPSDHVIEPQSSFNKFMRQAEQVASLDKIVVFGITPTTPKEGYGYILTKGRFKNGYLVERFIEKPDKKRAETLIKRKAFWNAGIFCFSKDTFLNELKALQPLMYRHYLMPLRQFLANFKHIPKDSIDYGIMQKTAKAALVKFDLKWSDLGSWDSFLQFHTKHNGNYKIGEVEFLDSDNCFAYSKNRLVCLVGLKDVLAIDSSDALLLIKKGESDKVKELVSLIEKKGHGHSKDSTTVYRPWGYYTILHEEPGYKVKEIGIYPHKALSLQQHHHRSEHWNVVFGEAHVMIGGKKLKIRTNESAFVPKKTKHKIYNPTGKISKIIEVQIGGYLGEDDIKRFDEYKK